MKLRYKIMNGLLGFIFLSISALAITLSYTTDCEDIDGLSALNSANSVEKMRAVVHQCYSSSNDLKVAQVDKPVPAADEVLVKIHAAGVNPLDYHMMRGAPYIMRLGSGIGQPETSILGADFSGVVESVGKDVTRFKVGDAVFGGSRGSFSDYLTIGQDQGIVHKPAEVTFQQSATVAVAAATALQALRDQGQLKAGEKVLINGASGGVGTYAVQIAKSMGAEVYGVCSGRNVDMVKSLGADHVFNYKQENYTEGEQTFDVIIDMISNHSISDNRKVLKPGGRYVIVGGAKGNWFGPLAQPIGAMIQDSFVEEKLIFFVAHFDQQDFEFLAELMASGKMRPVIDQVFPLEQVPAAISYSESGRAKGKIVIQINNS